MGVEGAADTGVGPGDIKMDAAAMSPAGETLDDIGARRIEEGRGGGTADLKPRAAKGGDKKPPAMAV